MVLVSDSRLAATLLMTATIRPSKGMPGTSRNDPDLRLKDYLRAFESYLRIDDKLLDQIVIFENSDADLSPFKKLAGQLNSTKKIHLINTPSDYPAERGKGYGEFFMLDYGIRILEETGAISHNTKIWKITGRLSVKNFSSILNSSPIEYEFYCDLRKVPFIGETLGGNRWMELRLFSFTINAYNELLRGQYGKGFVLEKEFFPIVENAYHSGNFKVFPRLLRQPVFHGYSGFSNASYTSAGYRMKNALRRILRKILPLLWL